MDVGTTFTLGEIVPGFAALIGIGISWGSLSSKIGNERTRTDEIIKRIEDRIASSADKREEIFRRMEEKITVINQRHESDKLTILDEVKKIETKIDIICDKIASMHVCRGADCVYRVDYERRHKGRQGDLEKE